MFSFVYQFFMEIGKKVCYNTLNVYGKKPFKEDILMSVNVEKLENSMAKLTIEVGADELEKAIEKAYQRNKNKIDVPGFRIKRASFAEIVW